MATAKKVDLTKNKTAAYSNNIVKMVNKSITEQARKINVPFFKLVSKTLNLESYFLNNVDYRALMGDNMPLLDRMVKSAICKLIAEDLESQINASSGYVGVWDNYTLYSITAATLTFMEHDTTHMLYLTAHPYAVISQEDLDKLDSSTYMAFDEYNPNRFTQMVIIIRNVVLETVAGMMVDAIPNVLLHPNAKSNAVYMRMDDMFTNRMKDTVQDVLKSSSEEEVIKYLNNDATERSITAVVYDIEQGFMNFIIDMLNKSGLSSNVINLAIGASRLHIYYDDPVDKKLFDIEVSFMLKSTDERFTATSVATTMSIGNIVLLALGYTDKIKKTEMTKIGKKLYAALMNYATYTINLYFSTMSANKNDAVSSISTAFEEELSELIEDI